jgi:D-alanyl-D-alanine endopeptidase (penicillin-binding protein 7)
VRSCIFVVAVALLSFGAAYGAEPAKKAPTATVSSKGAPPSKRVAVTYKKNGAKAAAAGAAVGAASVQGTGASANGSGTSSNGSGSKLDLKSSSALVFDASDGRALYAKNVDQVTPIASITKLMTAIVVLDAGLSLDEPIRIERADVDMLKHTGSRLRIGSAFTRRDLLHLALMSSENRAASALGRNFPGGIEEFVTQMNARAAELGMRSSRFVEPTGLSHGNVSTAEDLALLVQASVDYSLIREFSTTRNAQIHTADAKQMLGFGNSNGLVSSRQWQIDVSKTGYISESGLCLVMQARINDRPVIIVLLDSWGKYTRIGDANRIKTWLENGAASLAHAS